MKKVIFASLIVTLVSVSVFSQTTKTHNVNLTINNILELDFGATAQNLGFTFSTATDFESGKTNAGAAGLQVRSNKNWTVSVKANTANFTTTGGDAAVPASSLIVRKSGSGDIALTTADQTLATGNKGGFTSNNFLIDYFANPGYITPATYSLGVTFTVTAP